jgi:hypothetical protein
MTSLDASFLLDLILIVFAIFVLGIIGLALADLPCNARQDKSTSKENQQPADHDDNSSYKDKTAINDAQSDYTQRQSNHYERNPVSDYERRMIFLTVGIVGVTAFYTGVSIFQWNAMRTSNALIQKQLEATDRPWIKVIGAVANHPLIFHEAGSISARGDDFVNLGIKVIIQNVGRSVALNVNIRTDVIFVSMIQGAAKNPFTYPIETQKALCSKKPEAGLPINLFPGDDNRDQTGDDHDIPVSGNTFTIPADPPTVRRIMPIFIGCVDYTIGISGNIHQSRFIYELQERRDTN